MLFKHFNKFLNIFSADRMRKAGTGAATGALVAFVFYIAVLGNNIQTGLNRFLNFFLIAGLAVVSTLFMLLLLAVGIKIIQRSNTTIMALICGIILIAILLPGTFFSVPFILFQMAGGALIGLAFSKNVKKIKKSIAVIIVLAINILIFYFLMSPGCDKTISVAKGYWEHKKHLSQINDPSKTGPYPVQELFYGAGNDKHRPEYEKRISIKTNPVDATVFFDQSKGVKNFLRKLYWGFNSKNYPLNARVWYPLHDGRWPLVLILHGNHLMSDYSDPGYEYLGKQLASKGYIVASVDENFLNLAWFGDYYFTDLFTRAWLLLKHLENWRNWDQTPGSPFYKKVDIDNIALIGHSRGGEAAFIAAFLNNMNEYTLDASQIFNFKFSIKGIVQIAPTDAYNLQSEVPVSINNINYLLLHGGYDQDMYWQTGSRIYNRINFTDSNYHFKSSLYIYRANHGQFNTVWGRRDDTAPASWFLNTKSIMPGDQQRKIAQVFISAFLETVLKGKNEYIPLFKDYRTGFSVLPKDYYINMFADSRFRYLAKFNEDVQLNSASMKGCRIEGNNLKKWKEDAIPLRMENGSTQNNVGVFLGWDNSSAPGKTAAYTLHLTDVVTKSLKTDSVRNFIFDVCNSTNNINDIDFSIELITKSSKISTALKDHILLPPLLQTTLTKKNPFYRIKKVSMVERVMQTVEIPFGQFNGSAISFNPSELTAVKFIFDKTPSGEVILDNIGFY